jgi:tRNA A-37 threonylcarbamoyl transferase component Bud32
MGTVWRARDLELHREVAIKEVRPPDAALYEHSPELAAQQRERVMRESRALARLQHPNVVSIYQILENEGSPFPWIVMELVRGTSLDARLRQGPLAPQEAARIGRGVLGALRAAHAAGIHHRDVKPGNVLLRPDGSAVLTDFGIAALRDSTTLTATGEVIGSPEYIAPERLHGDETQTASDLWSLAMLLYVAVEGYHPMRRASTMATLAAVMTEPVPPPRRAGSLTSTLTSVLVPDPAARPNGEQLDRMLAAAEAGVPSGPQYQQQFRPPPRYPQPAVPSYQQPPEPRRNKAGLVAAAVSLAAVVAIAAAVLIMTRTFAKDDTGGTTNAGSGEGTTTNTVGFPGTQASPAQTVPPPTPDAAENLLTPDGARTAVAALTDEMGGTTVSQLNIYGDYATATAPTKAVENGFDAFEYRDGVAARTGADGVDADQAVLDLAKVNWDAIPALAKRAAKDLRIDKPTLRYLVVQPDLFDETPAMLYYLIDDYGAGYVEANLDGKVLKVYPRGS